MKAFPAYEKWAASFSMGGCRSLKQTGSLPWVILVWCPEGALLVGRLDLEWLTRG